MANRTVKDAISIKGTNPQYLVEKIIRSRIYDSRYWKEDCFALTAELLVDKAMELKSIGGVYGGNVKPSPFLCLILKMLQIQPEKDIIIEFIRNEDFKYVRALGAIYMRLTAPAADVYKYLEPLYIDYRKMKRMNNQAKYELVHMDEFIDELLHGERVCAIALPRLQKRFVLEDLNELEPRVSPLDVNFDEAETSSSESSSDDESVPEIKEKTKENRSHRRRSDSENESQRDRDKDREREHNRHRKADDEPSSSSASRHHHSSSSSKSKFKYVDYDNPRADDEMPRYKRSPELESKKRSKRSKSKDRHQSKNLPSSKQHRERERSRSKEKKPSSTRHKSSHKHSRRDDD
jgi:pre-mRNA-splicing factor 38A